MRNTRKEKDVINLDGIIRNIGQVKETKSNVNISIKSMESEDFDCEKFAKMPCNDA